MATLYVFNKVFEKNAGSGFTVRIPGLPDAADTTIFKVNPTLAAGDLKFYGDGTLDGNTTATPAAVDASGPAVSIALTQAETNHDEIILWFHDAADDEWCDVGVIIYTVSAVTVTPLDAAGIRTAIGMAAADLDTQLDALPTAAENRTEMDSNSTQLAAIVADTNELQTDDIPGLIADLPDDILDEVVEGTYTLRQIMRLIAAMLAGEASGGGTTTISFVGLDGVTTRIEMTVDADGNRSAVVLDVA